MTQQQIGHYRIKERIASGTQGSVYSAFEPGSGRLVALKVLHPHLSDTSDYLDRFHREASLIASVEHPNVVKVFDVGTDGENHYMALEFVPVDLSEHLETGPFPIEVAAGIAAGIADGLGSVHALEITHRDLKPHNVLMTPNGTPKVTDFGIARAETLPNATQTGAVMGTPYYMSPEQALGQAVDARTDVYALGCVMYQMLTHKVPFEASDGQSVLQKHIEEQHRSVKSLRSDVPDALNDVVDRALSKNPADRYADCAEMSEAIRLAMPGVPTTEVHTRIPTSDDKPTSDIPGDRTGTVEEPTTGEPSSPVEGGATIDIEPPTEEVPARESIVLPGQPTRLAGRTMYQVSESIQHPLTIIPLALAGFAAIVLLDLSPIRGETPWAPGLLAVGVVISLISFAVQILSFQSRPYRGRTGEPR